MQNPPDFTMPDIRTAPGIGDAPPPPVKPSAKTRLIGQSQSVALDDLGENSSTPVDNQVVTKPESTTEELLQQIARLQEELTRRQEEAARN